MTVFVASLFLPYTINFHPDEQRPESHGLSQRATLATIRDRRGPGSAPRSQVTPGATTEHEKIFTPYYESNINTPGEFPFPKANRQAATPSESLNATWGSSYRFTQPSRQASSHPPSSILSYSILEDPESSESEIQPALIRRKSHSRPASASGVEWTVETAENGNGGLHNAINAAAQAGCLTEKTWVGTLGMPTDLLKPPTRAAISEKMEDEYESLAVFVNDNEFDGHYSQFCRQVLWPAFHYLVQDAPRSKTYEEHAYDYYVKVNQAFADRIAGNYKHGDVIWVHDYHLLLVPAMLRKMLPGATIGFFMHVAFPSSEIFRCLGARKELLWGILGANTVAFQTNEYCYHFLQTCSRLLNVETARHGIQLENRFIHVRSNPIGVDPVILDCCRRSTEVEPWIQTIQDRYRGKRLIVARDRLDNTSGIKQKLLAYEIFLQENPEVQDEVVMIQVTTSMTQLKRLETQVFDIVLRINSQFSSLTHQPLVFLEQDIIYPQLLALLTVADVFMVTCLREGMNLTSHDFIRCQDGKYSGTHKHGSLIMSEFAGTASLFDGHELLVNPWDIRQCANAIKRALKMGSNERQSKWQALYNTIELNTASLWCGRFLGSLSHDRASNAFRDVIEVPRLPIKNVKAQYHSSEHRLLLLGLEGVLASWSSAIDQDLSPLSRAINILADLAEDTKNVVYVTSCRTPEELDSLFAGAPSIGLVADNGCFLREPGPSSRWIELTDAADSHTWKLGLSNIFQYFQERTPGSRIEERRFSLIFWHNEAEDTKLAARQASELMDQVNGSRGNQRYRACRMDGAVVAKPADIDKSTATEIILQKLGRSGGLPDFLFVAGNSREDEIVFHWANDLSEKKGIRHVTTVTLGSRGTTAQYSLTQGMTGVLSRLADSATDMVAEA